MEVTQLDPRITCLSRIIIADNSRLNIIVLTVAQR